MRYIHDAGWLLLVVVHTLVAGLIQRGVLPVVHPQFGKRTIPLHFLRKIFVEVAFERALLHDQGLVDV